MRAERDKRASILTAEGARASQILTAEGDKQGAILRAEGERAAAILRAEGQARSIDQVFTAVHRNDLDPKVLAYQYLQTLPELARGQGNTFWVIPSEVTSALSGIAQAFGRPGRGRPRDGAGPPGPNSRPHRPPARTVRPNSRRPRASTGPSATEAGGRDGRVAAGPGTSRASQGGWGTSVTRRGLRYLNNQPIAPRMNRDRHDPPRSGRRRPASAARRPAQPARVRRHRHPRRGPARRCSSTPPAGRRRPPTPSPGASSSAAAGTGPSTPCSPR